MVFDWQDSDPNLVADVLVKCAWPATRMGEASLVCTILSIWHT